MDTPRSAFLEFIMELSDSFILLSGLAVLAFLIFYVSRFEWRETVPGRATAYFLASLVAVLALSGLGRWLGPDYAGREFLRLLVYGSVLFTSVRMLLALASYYRGPNGEHLLPFWPKRRQKSVDIISETETTP